MRDKPGKEQESGNERDNARARVKTEAAQHDAEPLKDEGDCPTEPAEYSDEFAKMILEAAAGEFEEMDIDAFLAELDRQIAQLRDEEQNRQPDEGPT